MKKANSQSGKVSVLSSEASILQVQRHDRSQALQQIRPLPSSWAGSLKCSAGLHRHGYQNDKTTSAFPFSCQLFWLFSAQTSQGLLRCFVFGRARWLLKREVRLTVGTPLFLELLCQTWSSDKQQEESKEWKTMLPVDISLCLLFISNFKYI